MNKKIVVIGSNSFSGASFVDFALDAQIETVGISRSPEPHTVFLPYRWGKMKNVPFKFYQLDLNHDIDRIMQVIQSFKPNYVVNFASQSMVGESWQHPEHWFQTNVVATVKLHDRLRTCDFLEKYVHISTPEVYGNCEGMVHENQPFSPSTPYAVSRAAADMSLKSFISAYGFPAVFTRAANVYGPGQQLYRIIPRTILFFLTGRKLKLHGGGHSVRSFIHIRDVSEGTLRVAENSPVGEVYHLSTKTNISIRELVKQIADQLGVSFEKNVEAVGDRLGKDSAYLLDSSKARNSLGWDATISLEQGIEDTIGWVRKHIEIIEKQPLDYIHKP